DFNGDGRLDVAATGYSAVSVVLGKGDGTFQPPVTYSVVPGSLFMFIVAGDFTGDGHLDLAVTDQNFPSHLSLLLGDGDGPFHPGAHFAVGRSSTCTPSASDFNGDGLTDLAISVASENTVSVFLSNGDGTFQRAVNYAVGSYPFVLEASDFNGDGHFDLAVTNG